MSSLGSVAISVAPARHQLTLQEHIDMKIKRKSKGKSHTVETAPLSEETPPQKRSGMARIVEKFHSFACTPTRLYTNGINHTSLCLPRLPCHSLLVC